MFAGERVAFASLAGSVALGDSGFEAASADPVADGFRVIAAIGEHLAALSNKRPLECVQKRQQLPVIVDW